MFISNGESFIIPKNIMELSSKSEFKFNINYDVNNYYLEIILEKDIDDVLAICNTIEDIHEIDKILCKLELNSYMTKMATHIVETFI